MEKQEDKVKKMEQLVSMGFSEDLASQALAAAGPNSTVEQAADWILSRSSSSSQSQPSQLSPPPLSTSKIQPSLDRFFSPKPSQNPSPSQISKRPAAADQHQSSPSYSLQPKPKRPNREASSSSSHTPLSERMRPKSLSEILGQDHLLDPTSIIPSSLSAGRLPSLILWGPPGSGKTSLALAISRSLPSSPPHRFLSLSALTSSLKDLRSAIDESRRLLPLRTVLFIDEAHRFSKPHLDSLLPAVEDGSVTLIAATTENPSFHLTTPLLSRSRVLPLRPLNPDHISSLLARALTHLGLTAQPAALDFISHHCDGDARVALNALESSVALAAGRKNPSDPVTVIEVADTKEAMQCGHLAYDRDGEEHYNLISALHKSMRGGDANAAIYWLARMVEGGEQPLYIARRLVRFASEDVGLADPSAMAQAVACYQACHFVGMPECDVSLAQCVAYLALAPKSVAVYKALGEARRAVRERAGGSNEGVPIHLRNAPTKMMKEFGYGDGYVYTPDDPEGSKSQTYLPPSLQGRKFLHWPPPKEQSSHSQDM